MILFFMLYLESGLCGVDDSGCEKSYERCNHSGQGDRRCPMTPRETLGRLPELTGVMKGKVRRHLQNM